MGTHPIFESDFDCLTECRSTDPGNNIEITRTYSTPAGEQAVTNAGVIGAESEYNFLGNKIMCAISGSDGDLTVKATSGWCTVTVKVDGDNLTETIPHNESGVSMSNTWAR